jgi:hypothetical protein
MSDVATPIGAIEMSEARVRSASVRDQLRALEAELKTLASDVPDASPMATVRLERARLNVRQAIEQICTDAQQSPF